MNVLLLDDDPFILSLLNTVLVKWGHRVFLFTNPSRCPIYFSKACPCTLNECPDIVLTDVNMPTINGMKFIEELKRKCCKCPTLGMMSGDWGETDLRKAVQMGATVFSKPFNLPSLHAWLASATVGVATI